MNIKKTEGFDFLKEISREGLFYRIDGFRKRDRLKGKVLCFVPQWEKSYFNFDFLDLNFDQKDYILKNHGLIESAKFSNQKIYNSTIFVAYKEKFNSSIKIFPWDAVTYRTLETEGFHSRYFLYLIIIDYDEFEDSFIELFLNCQIKSENREKISENYLGSFAKLWKNISSDNKSYSYAKIVNFLNKNYYQSLQLEDLDAIDHLGKFSTEQLEISKKEIKATREGYLWCENRPKGNFNDYSKEEVKIFYSLESLLFYELKEVFLKSKRCDNCGNVLPDNYKGKYCREPDCIKKRAKNRKRKSREENKKVTS